MPSFFLAFIAGLLISVGSRDQLLVAQLSVRLGRSYSLLIIGALVAIITASIMAWAGQAAARVLPPEGKTMLVAIAMLLAAVELAWPSSHKAPKEPTRSLIALAVVLFSRQLGDASRLLILAIAAATGAPLLAGIGGALGGGGALAIGWFAGADLAGALPVRKIRLALAAVILTTGVLAGLSARGLIA